MGLQARIAADATRVFLKADSGRLGSFRKTIAHWPAGVEADSEDVYALVMLEDELLHQGEEIQDEQGRRIRRHGKLELLDSVAVTVVDRPENCSIFVIDEEEWRAVRIEGRDEVAGGLQTVIIRRDDKVWSRRPTTRG